MHLYKVLDSYNVALTVSENFVVKLKFDPLWPQMTPD